MKHGTAYGKRVKRFYARIKKQNAEPEIGPPTDPLEQLVLAVFSQESTLANARRAWDKLYQNMVDLNEVRVSSPREIADIIDPLVPNGLACAARLCGLLNAVFLRKNTLKLDSLQALGKREAKRWLEQLERIEPYHVASVLLWSLGGHAVPVNTRLLAAMRKEGLVEPTASVAEVQSFLERHIPPAEAKAFCLSMDGFAPAKRASGAKAASAAGRPPTKASVSQPTASSPTARRDPTAQPE